MSETLITPRHAWQPLTPRGVAAFAADSLGRLLLVQLLVAALVAAMAVWFVNDNWFPVARDAVQALPDHAELHDGHLLWTNTTPLRLAGNRFLALNVDDRNAGTLGREADVELALHDNHFVVGSLLGVMEFPYQRDWAISLCRADAIPWWGAWELPLLALLAGAVGLALLVSLWVLATLYTPFVKAFAFYANRQLGWRGSWKLASAALLPGAFVVAAGIFCYGSLGIDLLQLGLFYLLHFITTWVYIAASPFFLPKEPAVAAPSANPFQPAEAVEEAPPAPAPPPAPAASNSLVESSNPFTTPPGPWKKLRRRQRRLLRPRPPPAIPWCNRPIPSPRRRGRNPSPSPSRRIPSPRRSDPAPAALRP